MSTRHAPRTISGEDLRRYEFGLLLKRGLFARFVLTVA
jgi:hypothetical protein